MHTIADGALCRLVCGLADQDIRADKPFFYDGGRLLAEDVITLGMPSILCLADRLSASLGLGSLGYRFVLGAQTCGFPLAAERDGDRTVRPFATVAPLLYDVYVNDVRECRADLAQLFERAARVIDPQFLLARDAVYSPTLLSAPGVDFEASTFDLG